MNRQKLSKKLILGVIVCAFIIVLGLPYQDAASEELIPDDQNQGTDTTSSVEMNENGDEIAKEFTEEEYQRQIEEMNELPPGYVVLYDLEDPEGIDPDLLPPHAAAMVDSDTKIVAYRETARVTSVQASEELFTPDPFHTYSHDLFYQDSFFGIPCLSSDPDNH